MCPLRLIYFFVFALISYVSFAGAIDLQKLPHPEWATHEIDMALARYQAWKGADETVAFTLMTDVHSHLTEIPKNLFSDPQGGVPRRFHALFAQAAAVRAKCDFLVDTGDHDYDLGIRPEKNGESLQRMALTQKVYAGFDALPVLFAMGNHDHGPYSRQASYKLPISSDLFGETFNGLAATHKFKFVFGTNKSWGYYDVPGKNFRSIFCNTSDGAYYGMTTNQIDFIKQALETLPPHHTAVLFGHYCVYDEIGHWKPFTKSSFRNKEAFINLLEEFVKRRPNDLVGYICGDSHFSNELELRGVNWTISQGYGGVNLQKNCPWGGRVVRFNRSKQMIFELIAVKPAKGEFRVFRVGAGGEACDRTCYYWNQFPQN